MSLFKKERTLEELEQENETTAKEVEVYRNRAEIARLKAQIDARGGKGFWKKIVGDSKGNGAVQKMMKWISGK
jgi:hypothetical protein